MLQEKDRKIAIISFVAGLVFILATIAAKWNTSIAIKQNLGVLPLVYAIIAVASLSYLYRLAFRLSDTKAFNEYTEEQVAAGRTALLVEIQKKEEERKNKETVIDDIPEKAKELIPSGNFKNIESFGKKLLVSLANEMNLVQGILYITHGKEENFSFSAGYALEAEKTPENFKIGENLNGEAAKNQEMMIINDIPENYFNVESGLGNAQPGHLCIIPIISEKKTIALLELASFAQIKDKDIKILEQVAELISEKIKQIVKAKSL